MPQNNHPQRPDKDKVVEKILEVFQNHSATKYQHRTRNDKAIGFWNRSHTTRTLALTALSSAITTLVEKSVSTGVKTVMDEFEDLQKDLTESGKEAGKQLLKDRDFENFKESLSTKLNDEAKELGKKIKAAESKEAAKDAPATLSGKSPTSLETPKFETGTIQPQKGVNKSDELYSEQKHNVASQSTRNSMEAPRETVDKPTSIPDSYTSMGVKKQVIIIDDVNNGGGGKGNSSKASVNLNEYSTETSIESIPESPPETNQYASGFEVVLKAAVVGILAVAATQKISQSLTDKKLVDTVVTQKSLEQFGLKNKFANGVIELITKMRDKPADASVLFKDFVVDQHGGINDVDQWLKVLHELRDHSSNVDSVTHFNSLRDAEDTLLFASAYHVDRNDTVMLDGVTAIGRMADIVVGEYESDKENFGSKYKNILTYIDNGITKEESQSNAFVQKIKNLLPQTSVDRYEIVMGLKSMVNDLAHDKSATNQRTKDAIAEIGRLMIERDKAGLLPDDGSGILKRGVQQLNRVVGNVDVLQEIRQLQVQRQMQQQPPTRTPTPTYP